MDIDVLIFFAHPDDAEFGVAGSVARWCSEGAKVVYVVCTNGEKGTTDRDMNPEYLAEIRKKEQQAAADILGVREVVFLGYPDQGLEDTPTFRKEIVKQIRYYRPHTIITSDPYRRYIWHRDHRIIGQVVLDAVYPYARDHLAYPEMIEQGLEPHKVKEIWFCGADDINYWIDITDFFHLKLKALKCHKSQVREMDIADIEDWLRRRCQNITGAAKDCLVESFHRLVIE